MPDKTCPRCEYQWVSRKPSPLECPRCKRRLELPVALDLLDAAKAGLHFIPMGQPEYRVLEAAINKATLAK